MNLLLNNIGVVIKSVRQDLNMSLDNASQVTGVSKAMLGQIERGESNPTVSTLWKISSGLRIPFSRLLSEESTNYSVTELNEISPVYEDNGKFILYNIFPFNPITAFDYFYMIVKPGCRYKSPSHANVFEEYIVVTQGRLELEIERQTLILETGASIKFKGDVEHVYANSSDEITIFQNVIKYHHPSGF